MRALQSMRGGHSAPLARLAAQGLFAARQRTLASAVTFSNVQFATHSRIVFSSSELSFSLSLSRGSANPLDSGRPQPQRALIPRPPVVRCCGATAAHHSSFVRPSAVLPHTHTRRHRRSSAKCAPAERPVRQRVVSRAIPENVVARVTSCSAH